MWVTDSWRFLMDKDIQRKTKILIIDACLWRNLELVRWCAWLWEVVGPPRLWNSLWCLSGAGFVSVGGSQLWMRPAWGISPHHDHHIDYDPHLKKAEVVDIFRCYQPKFGLSTQPNLNPPTHKTFRGAQRRESISRSSQSLDRWQITDV